MAVVLTAVTTPLNAFAALSTGCAMYLYISYAMPIVAGFFAEGKTWTSFGSFRLGGLSKVFAVIVMIGTVLVTIGGHAFVVSIPSSPGDAAANPPVPASDFVPGLWYYSVGFAIILGILWFAIENRRFQGPPIGEAAIAKRKAVIAAAEKAVGETAQATAKAVASSLATAFALVQCDKPETTSAGVPKEWPEISRSIS